MKTLSITTIREFKTDKEYEDYKATMIEAGLNLDWKRLETVGQDLLTTHQQNEKVITIFNLDSKEGNTNE